MADLNVTADFADLEKLKAIFEALGPQFGKVVARLQRESKQLENAMEASALVMATAMKEVVGANAQRDLATWGAAQRKRLALMQESEKIALRQASAELKVVEALKEQQRVAAQSFQSQIGGNLGLGAQGISASASADVFANEMERLKLKYNEAYAAEKLYLSAKAEITRAEALESVTLEEKIVLLDRLEKEYTTFKAGTASSMNMFVQGANAARSSTNQMGVVVQQAGYQVGDFLVQVQSGTNWMVAFGQQATQLVGVLPLMSSTLGMTTSSLIAWSTGLGIVIPLLTAIGAAWMRSSEQAGGASKVVDDYTKAIQASASEVENLNAKLLELRYPDLTDSQRLLKVQIDEVSKSLLEQSRVVGDLIDMQERLSSGAGVRGAGSVGLTLATAKETLKELVAKINELREAYQEVADKAKLVAIGASERARFEEKIRQQVEAILGPLRQQKANIDQIKSLMLEVSQINLNGPWDNLLGIIKANVEEARKYASTIGGGRSLGMGGPALDPYGFRGQLEDQANWKLPGSGSDGSGGGGGGSNPLDSLIKELQTEKETLDTWKKESLAIIQSSSDAELAILGGKNEAKLRLEQEYQDKLKSIVSAETNYRLTEMGSMFGALADLAGVGGKKMLRVQATLSAAATTIAAYETAVKAAAEAKTIPGRIAAYAKFLAVGLGAVKQIQSAGGIGGGGGGGGGVGTSTVSSQTAAPNPQTVYIDSLDPAGLYSGQMLINLFEAFYDENDKRGKVFVVGR